MTTWLRRLWLNNWDALLIWSAVLVIALLIGGALAATVEAVQHAASYR